MDYYYNYNKLSTMGFFFSTVLGFEGSKTENLIEYLDSVTFLVKILPEAAGVNLRPIFIAYMHPLIEFKSANYNFLSVYKYIEDLDDLRCIRNNVRSFANQCSYIRSSSKFVEYLRGGYYQPFFIEIIIRKIFLISDGYSMAERYGFFPDNFF